LVGDSVSMVLYGNNSTLSATLEMMIAHAKAVTKVVKSALVVVDMPVGSYESSPSLAYENAKLILAKTNAKAIKLEGGNDAISATIAFLTQKKIAVMAHIGVLPQSVGATGNYAKVGKSEEDKIRLMKEAKAVEKAGAFAVVLENIEHQLAHSITRSLTIPTIGIGSGDSLGGQIAVSEDILGLSQNPPPFVKPLANLKPNVREAFKAYARLIKK